MKNTLIFSALLIFATYSHLYADTQHDFIAIAIKYQKELNYEQNVRSSTNDVRIRRLMKKRTEEYNAMQFDGHAQNWKGVITSANAIDDSIYVTIEIAPKVLLKVTTNFKNRLSDTIAEMDEGQKVIFSGHLEADPGGCGYREQSFTTAGSLREPEFKFVLTDIRADR